MSVDIRRKGGHHLAIVTLPPATKERLLTPLRAIGWDAYAGFCYVLRSVITLGLWALLALSAFTFGAVLKGLILDGVPVGGNLYNVGVAASNAMSIAAAVAVQGLGLWRVVMQAWHDTRRALRDDRNI